MCTFYLSRSFPSLSIKIIPSPLLSNLIFSFHCKNYILLSRSLVEVFNKAWLKESSFYCASLADIPWTSPKCSLLRYALFFFFCHFHPWPFTFNKSKSGMFPITFISITKHHTMLLFFQMFPKPPLVNKMYPSSICRMNPVHQFSLQLLPLKWIMIFLLSL